MSYIGQHLPPDAFHGFTTDTFTGDGSATTFTLSKAPFSEDSLIVVVDNVIQQPTTNFTVSGTTLTIVGTAILSGITGYAIHTGGALPIGEANALDLQGQSDKLILDADADTTISADTDDQIDIKIAGADDFQFTANTFTAQSGSTITTPTLGVVNTKDLGAGIHIKTADSSGSANASGDELVIENNGPAGMTILSANDNVGLIAFGDDGASNRGYIQYSHADDAFSFGTAASTAWTVTSGGDLLPGATDHGIHLGVTTAGDANLLDDYEEGTWTPVIKSNANTISGGTRLATYTKVGRMVHVFFSIAGGTTTGTIDNSGDFFRIQGLPFTSANVTGTRYIGTQLNYYSSFSMSEENVLGLVGQNTTVIEFVEHDGTATGYSAARLNSVGSNSYAQFAVVYYVE
jgi:hypothetical protein